MFIYAVLGVCQLFQVCNLAIQRELVTMCSCRFCSSAKQVLKLMFRIKISHLECLWCE